MATKQRLAQVFCVVGLLAFSFSGFFDDRAIHRELELIRDQNRILQEQVKRLTEKVDNLESKQDTLETPHDYSKHFKTNAAFPALKIGLQGGLGWAIDTVGNKSAFFVDDVNLSL